MKICSKTHQIAPFKKIFSGKHAPEPPSKCLATPRVASRFTACRQLIVCSTLYVYALQNLFRGAKND